MRKKWSFSHQELRPIILNLKYNYQPEKGSIKITKWKKLCKSEQRKLDAVCHTFSVKRMPLGDFKDTVVVMINKLNEN